MFGQDYIYDKDGILIEYCGCEFFECFVRVILHCFIQEEESVGVYASNVKVNGHLVKTIEKLKTFKDYEMDYVYVDIFETGAIAIKDFVEIEIELGEVWDEDTSDELRWCQRIQIICNTKNKRSKMFVVECKEPKIEEEIEYVELEDEIIMRSGERNLKFRKTRLALKEMYTDPYYRFQIDEQIYTLAVEIWGKRLAPFITECLYSFEGPCWKHQMRNLIGMLVVDTALEYDKYDQIEEKWTLFSNVVCQARMGWYTEAIRWDYLEKAKRIACKMHGKIVPYFGWRQNFAGNACWHDYYEYVVKPMMKSIAVSGACGKLFEYVDDWRFVANQLKPPVHLDEEIVKFLVEDAINYVVACDCSQYNPLWIFGSECYEEIMKDINCWMKEEPSYYEQIRFEITEIKEEEM